MCCSAKASLIAFWIFAVMGILLWYRNESYDRVIAAFSFTLALSQLINYGSYTGVDSAQAGKGIYITLWTQILVLIIGVYIATRKTTITTGNSVSQTWAGLLLALFSLFFVIALIYAVFGNASFSAHPGQDGKMVWSKNGGDILGNWWWLYVAGIFAALFILWSASKWRDASLLVLLVYTVFSVAFVALTSSPTLIGPSWTYVAVGFVFITWMGGLYRQVKT